MSLHFTSLQVHAQHHQQVLEMLSKVTETAKGHDEWDHY
jgi:hypothetical protein